MPRHFQGCGLGPFQNICLTTYDHYPVPLTTSVHCSHKTSSQAGPFLPQPMFFTIFNRAHLSANDNQFEWAVHKLGPGSIASLSGPVPNSGLPLRALEPSEAKVGP